MDREHLDTIQATGTVAVSLTPAEEVAGGPMRPAVLRLEWGGGHVTMHSTYAQDVGTANAILRELADMLPERLRCSAAASNAFHERDREIRKRESAEHRLASVLTGKPSIGAFGDLFVRVADDGSAWLLDPEKRERGIGFRFASLDVLWREHPSLRPVRWGSDDEGAVLIVRPFAMEGGA